MAPRSFLRKDVQSDTRLGAPVVGLPSSAITYMDPLLRCCDPQEGVDVEGVFKADTLLLTLRLIGVKMFVGVRPVRPSMRASKFRLLIALVGVSIGIPSKHRIEFDFKLVRLREAGLWGFP